MRLRSVSLFDLLLVLLIYLLQTNTSLLPPTLPTPTPKESVLPITAPPSGYYFVTKVVDGDTLTVTSGGHDEKVRLIGIDTPEVVDPRKPIQCFGKEASAKMKELVSGKNVRLVPDPTQDDKDKYGRVLRYVYLPNGVLVNRAMIEEGYAYEYTYDAPYEFQQDFRSAEQAARNAEKGLWREETCPLR